MCDKNKEISENEFICDACNGRFYKSWTEAEALAEKAENGWHDMDTSSMAEVCDDCYKEIMEFNEPLDFHS